MAVNRRHHQVRPKLPRFWCCGSLESGAIAVGVTNLVTTFLLFLWIAQIVLEFRWYFISLIITCLVTFVILVVNTCLIFGASSRSKNLVLPWLVAYIVIVLGIILTCSVKFHELDQLKPVAITCIIILVYFYFVVAAFFHELRADENLKAGNGDDAAEKGGEDRPDCLINLQEQVEQIGDDTFSDLAESRLVNGSSSTNPFLNPSLLPQPDEVIPVTSIFHSTVAQDTTADESGSNLFQAQCNNISKSIQADLKAETEGVNVDRSQPTWQSQFVLSSQDKSDEAVADETNPASDSTVVGRKPKVWHSHTGLPLAGIDSTFSPFKQKNKDQLPKMKVFLPKGDAESSDESSDSDSSSSAVGVEATSDEPKVLPK